MFYQSQYTHAILVIIVVLLLLRHVRA